MQVTTVHSKQVFLAPGQQGFSPNLSNGALRGAPPFALYWKLVHASKCIYRV